MRITFGRYNPPRQPVFAAKQPIIRPLQPLQADTVSFGARHAVVRVPASPPLHLIPWHAPVQVPVLKIEALKPSGHEKTADADVFRLTLDITDTTLVDKDGNPQLWPGQHLRIKADIPDTDEMRYLEDLQRSKWMPNRAPVTDEAHRKYLNTRRYSVADVQKHGDGRVTATLIIRRVEYELGGKEQRGIVSNQLAAKKPGDLVKITGPDKNHFLLPKRSDNMLVFCTGISSIGPIEYMLRTRLLHQRGKLGETRMITGYKYRADEIKREEFLALAKNRRKKFSYDVAYSREADNPQHIQDVMGKDGRKILDLLLKDNTYVYMCGVRDVEVTIYDKLLALGEEYGCKDAVVKRIEAMRANGQWRMEGVRSPVPYKG